MPTKIDLAWVAGLFEGEGSITIAPLARHDGAPQFRYFALHVRLGMTDEQEVRIVHGLMGGYFHHRGGDRINRKPVYEWTVTSRKAGEVLRMLLPYFRSNRVIQKARLALAFQDQKQVGSARYDSTYSARQQEFFMQMRVLNERGLNNRHVQFT